MAIILTNKADFTVAECDGELTIFFVSELYQQIRSLQQAQPTKLLVDLTAVQDFDSAGLQLLLWLKSRLIKTDFFQLLIDENDVVGKLLTLYGLNDKLDCSELQTEVETAERCAEEL